MGNSISANSHDPSHIRIYNSIIQIKNPQKRVQMINTCIAGMEYTISAKRAGVYSYLLNYVSSVNSGQVPPLLPGENYEEEQVRQTVYETHQGINMNVPRSMQPVQVPIMNSALTVHPSIRDQNAYQYTQPQYQHNTNRGQGQNVGQRLPQGQLVEYSEKTGPAWQQITKTPKQKVLSYFSSCLEVLGIEEEVALTEESLKQSYKKVALRAHPDKGGSEEYFEAVTRAYAYLSEILKQIKGGRKTTSGTVEAPSSLGVSRDQEANKWKHVDPVKLNPKNLDMNAFNRMFEQTHMPDPDSDGYGDWLKNADSAGGSNAPKFSGGFNRDVFNQMFEGEARKNKGGNGEQIMLHPSAMALTMAPSLGVDLVGERPETYTAAPNSKFQFTDLRGAYTTENTISEKVAGVVVSERSFDQYKSNREKAPDPFTQSELHSIQEFENRQKQQEDIRERRKAEMNIRNQQYFDRMKQYVITDKS